MLHLDLTQPVVIDEQVNLLLSDPASWFDNAIEDFRMDCINTITGKLHKHRDRPSYPKAMIVAVKEFDKRARSYKKTLAISFKHIQILIKEPNFDINNEILCNLIGSSIMSLQISYICKLSYVDLAVLTQLHKIREDISFLNRLN